MVEPCASSASAPNSFLPTRNGISSLLQKNAVASWMWFPLVIPDLNRIKLKNTLKFRVKQSVLMTAALRQCG